MGQHTSHWSIDVEEIRLGMQNLCSFLEDIKCMVLFELALPVEMILKIGNVRLALFRFGKELLVGRDVHSRGLNLQAHFPPRAQAMTTPSVKTMRHGSRGKINGPL